MELHIIAPGKPVITMRSGVNWVDLISPNSISADTWSHLAATYDGTTCKLYINGTMVNSVALTNYIPGNGTMYLGRRYYDMLLYSFKGKIDETALWNTARSVDEIKDDMAGIVPAANRSLKAYYPFNQGIAEGNNSGLTTLTDTTANKLKGTLVNFALSGTTSNWVYGVWQPSVTTQLLSALTSTSATVNWDLTLLGNPAPTIHGICWNTSGTPTLTDTHADNSSVSTTGAFTYNLTNLTPGTDYYVRAYATSIMGTVYGREIKFTTPQNAPVIAYSNTSLTNSVNSTITAISPTNTGGVVPATTPGNIIVLAGSGSQGSLDATGSNASFNRPNSIATDHSNNIFITDGKNNKIRKITPDGVVTTLAGNGSQGSDDGTGTAASFNEPSGIATDTAGNVYVSDPYNSLIRKITPSGVVTTLAGSGGFEGLDGIGLAASFSYAISIATDALGNISVADFASHKIRKITAEGVVTTLAGSGSEGSLDATGIAASFDYPNDVATDALGNIYVADSRNHKIRKITPEGVVTTVAGNGTNSSIDGIGLAAGFSYPDGIATDAANNIYVAESGSIRKITPDGKVTTLANPEISVTYTDVATDAAGNLYATDINGNRILKITPYGYSISPALPAGLNFDATTGTISGTPNVTSAPCQYTITASNYAGTNTTTITLAITGFVPSVSTQDVSNITATTATGNGFIDYLGIPNPTAHGICWNKTGNPTLSDNKIDNGAASATGSFTSSLTGLTSGTTYYVKAFATNAYGTVYGAEVNFTTTFATGMETKSLQDITISPNPCTNGFTINADEKACMLYMYDLTGKLVLSQQLSNSNYVNVESLKAGIYVVKVDGKEYKLMKK
jgi:sugar lactone lactonase YvrE